LSQPQGSGQTLNIAAKMIRPTEAELTAWFAALDDAGCDLTSAQLEIMAMVNHLTSSHDVAPLETMAATRSISITGLTKLQAAIRIATS